MEESELELLKDTTESEGSCDGVERCKEQSESEGDGVERCKEEQSAPSAKQLLKLQKEAVCREFVVHMKPHFKTKFKNKVSSLSLSLSLSPLEHM